MEQLSGCQANSQRCRSGWGLVVFNIKDNDARLIITYINYEMGTVTVLAVLTSKEYDKGGWKNACKLLNEPAKYLIKDEAPKTIFFTPATRSIYLGFWSCNAKTSNGGRNGNRKAADRSDRGLRREAFHHRKAFWGRGAQGIDGYKWPSTKGSCGGSGAKVLFPDPERKAPAEQTTDGKTQPAFSRLTGSFLLAPFR